MCHRQLTLCHVYDLDTSAPDAVKLVSGISTIVTSKRRYPGMNSMSLVLHAVIVHWTCFIPTCTTRTGLCPCRHSIAPITVWSIFCPAIGLSCSNSPSHKNCWRLLPSQSGPSSAQLQACPAATAPVTKTVGGWSKDSKRL